MLTNRVEGSTVYIIAESLMEAVNWLESTPRKWRQDGSSRLSLGSRWDLGLSWDATVEMARTGWHIGMNEMARKLAVIPPNEIEPEWTYDVAGGVPDIGRYVAGEVEHMRDFGHPLGRKPCVQLIVNVCSSCGVSSGEYVNYGTAITSLIDQLENNGRSAEVFLTSASRYDGAKRSVVGWRVKTAGDALDLGAMAFSLAHPAAFRRLTFAFEERGPVEFEPWMGGYGGASTLTKMDAVNMDAEGAFLLDGIGTSFGACKTMQGALKLAAQQINKAAGETLVELEGGEER